MGDPLLVEVDALLLAVCLDDVHEPGSRRCFPAEGAADVHGLPGHDAVGRLARVLAIIAYVSIM